jgi:hypothetical protein
MKKRTLLMFCMLLLAISCAKKEETAKPEELGDLQPPFAGRVTASSLFIRSGPDANASIAGKILKNRRIDVKAILAKKETIGGKTARWYKVEAEGVSGYSFGAFIEQAKAGDKLDLPKAEKVFSCPKSIHNSLECARYLEKMTLPGVSGRAERKGGDLRITCKNGTVVTFTDNSEESDSMVFYLLVRHYADVDHFLVFVQFYEGGRFTLVSGGSGAKVDLWDEPHYSPDRRRFICANTDLEARYTPNGVQVFRFDASSFTSETEMKLEWGPADPVWTDNNRIVLVRYYFIAPGGLTPFEAVMEFKDNKWFVH